MTKKQTLLPAVPQEAHDHFRKASVLHDYVLKELDTASKHALEAGQELIAAKRLIPHGRWGSECDRIFSASASTAQFYMQFATNMGALPKTQRSRVLMLEGSLTGAAKLAKKTARALNPPTPRKSRQGTLPPKKGKAVSKVSAASLVDALSKKHIGQIARGLTAIAEANGGEGFQFKRANDGLNELIKGIKEMRKGKQ